MAVALAVTAAPMAQADPELRYRTIDGERHCTIAPSATDRDKLRDYRTALIRDFRAVVHDIRSDIRLKRQFTELDALIDRHGRLDAAHYPADDWARATALRGEIHRELTRRGFTPAEVEVIIAVPHSPGVELPLLAPQLALPETMLDAYVWSGNLDEVEYQRKRNWPDWPERPDPFESNYYALTGPFSFADDTLLSPAFQGAAAGKQDRTGEAARELRNGYHLPTLQQIRGNCVEGMRTGADVGEAQPQLTPEGQGSSGSSSDRLWDVLETVSLFLPSR
ncbi:hypothetical protein [Corynebacterium halotolerans]|uniref:hypothetical protein n=1 Tax=Corynebacterium halotolerans TaxID=225326 RepID=UPI0011EA7036|nr:hypothetical protein [Corynebacterium halotolerans]